jgi:hypothetical protein
MRMAYTAGRWGDEAHTQQWVDVVATLTRRRHHLSGSRVLVDLRAFPATLILYAFGLGSVVGQRPQLLGKLVAPVVDTGRRRLALGDQLNVAAVISDGGGNVWKRLTKYASTSVPGSELMADALRPLSQDELYDEVAFDVAFTRLELALSLGWAERVSAPPRFWAPPVGAPTTMPAA